MECQVIVIHYYTGRPMGVAKHVNNEMSFHYFYDKIPGALVNVFAIFYFVFKETTHNQCIL